MTHDEVLSTLRAHEPELKAAGVMSLALFGSVARGDNQPGSDVDVIVQLDEAARHGGAKGCLLRSLFAGSPIF